MHYNFLVILQSLAHGLIFCVIYNALFCWLNNFFIRVLLIIKAAFQRFWLIFLFYFLIDLFSLSNGANWGGHIAHLGGAIFGYLYIRDIYRNTVIDNFISRFTALFKPKAKMKITHRKESPKPSNTNTKQQRYGRPNQQEIDSILDKISQSGYDSLTKNEKELLFAASHED